MSDHYSIGQAPSAFNRLRTSTDAPTSPAQQRDVQRSEDVFYTYRTGWYSFDPMEPVNAEDIVATTTTAGGNLRLEELQDSFNRYAARFQDELTHWNSPVGFPGAGEPLEPWQPFRPTVQIAPAEEPERAPTAPKKIAKIRKRVSPKDILKQISKHTQKKKEALARTTATKLAEVAQQEEALASHQANVERLRDRSRAYTVTLKQVADRKLEQTLPDQIAAVQQLEQIEQLTLDSMGRVIVTTKPLFVEIKSEKKTIGQYQLRIDFSQDYIDQGVRVLNITQRAGGYDSPTISNTSCCWGNAAEEVQLDFFSQNLLELVEDMLAYIVSPNTQSGFLGRGGEVGAGWEAFLKRATPKEKGYSWEKYDKEKDNRWGQLDVVENELAVPAPTAPTYTIGLDAATTTANFVGLEQYPHEVASLRVQNNALTQTINQYQAAQVQPLAEGAVPMSVGPTLTNSGHGSGVNGVGGNS